MKIVKTLTFLSPEDVLAKARKAAPSGGAKGAEDFLVSALVDPRKMAFAAAFDALIREALKGEVSLDALGSDWDDIQTKIKGASSWLAEMMAIDPDRFDAEGKATLSLMGIRPKPYLQALIEQMACGIAVCENSRYQMVDLKEAFVEEKAVLRFHAQMEALYERALKASERAHALGPRDPDA